MFTHFPPSFILFILSVFIAIRIRRHFFLPRLPELTVPSFVRILNPLPGEEGRHLLIWSDPANGEYRVGLRGAEGAVRSYTREDLEEWTGALTFGWRGPRLIPVLAFRLTASSEGQGTADRQLPSEIRDASH